MWPGPPRVEHRMAHAPPPVGPRRSFGRGRVPPPPGPVADTPGTASQRFARANNAAIASLLPMSAFNFGSAAGGQPESHRLPRAHRPPQSSFPPPPPNLLRGGSFPSQNSMGAPQQNSPVFAKNNNINGQFTHDENAGQNFNTRSPSSNYRQHTNDDFNNNYRLRHPVPGSTPNNNDPSMYLQPGGPMPPFGNPAMYRGMQPAPFGYNMPQQLHAGQIPGPVRMHQPQLTGASPRMPFMPQQQQIPYMMPAQQQQQHAMGQFPYGFPADQRMPTFPGAQSAGLLAEPPIPAGPAPVAAVAFPPTLQNGNSILPPPAATLPVSTPSLPDAESIPLPAAPMAANETTNQQRQLAKVRLLHPLTRKKPNLSKDGEPVNPSEVVPIFIGNMDDRVSEVLIRNLLSLCGSVHNWRRVQSPQANFGFCDFGSAEAACRTVRLLDGLVLGGKTLNVKIGNKNPDRVVQYKREVMAKLGMPADAPLPESNKFRVDPATRAADEECRLALRGIVSTHQEELSRPVSTNTAVFIGSSRSQLPTTAKEENPTTAPKPAAAAEEAAVTKIAVDNKPNDTNNNGPLKDKNESSSTPETSAPQKTVVGHITIEEEKLDIVTEQIHRFRQEAARRQQQAASTETAAPTKTIEIRLQPPKHVVGNAASAATVNGADTAAGVKNRSDSPAKQNAAPASNNISPKVDTNNNSSSYDSRRGSINRRSRSRQRSRSRSRTSRSRSSRQRDNRAVSRPYDDDRHSHQQPSRSRSRSTTRNRQRSTTTARSRSRSNTDSRGVSIEQRRNASRTNLQQQRIVNVSPSPERQERHHHAMMTHVRDADDRLEHKYNKRRMHRVKKEREMSEQLNIETDKLKGHEERRRRLLEIDAMRRRKEDMDDQSRKRKLFDFLSCYDDDVEDARYFGADAFSLLCERYAKEQRLDAAARAESEERYRIEDEQRAQRARTASTSSRSKVKSRIESDRASPAATSSHQNDHQTRAVSQSDDDVDEEQQDADSPHREGKHRRRDKTHRRRQNSSVAEPDADESAATASPDANFERTDDENAVDPSPRSFTKASRRNSELNQRDITAREAARRPGGDDDDDEPQNTKILKPSTKNGEPGVVAIGSKKNNRNGLKITSAAAFRGQSDDDDDEKNNNERLGRTKSSSSDDAAPPPSADENATGGRGDGAARDVDDTDDAAAADHNDNAVITETHSSRAPVTFASEKEFAHNLIRHIPNDLEGVFQWDLDPPMIDQLLIDRKIRPWVDKKMAAFFGSPETDITEYVCKSLLEQKNANALLRDVSEFLEDEASNFMLNLWRKLIYEVEARKHGFGVAQS